MTNLTAQEIINRITRGLELTRKQFAKPKATPKATRGPTRSATVKQRLRAGGRARTG